MAADVSTIRALVDQASALSTSFTFNVTAADFAAWLGALGVNTFSVNMRDGGDDRVHAHASGYHNGTYFQLHCVCAGIDDHAVPARDAKRRWLELPAAEAVKLHDREP